jgi:predicted secreted protein
MAKQAAFGTSFKITGGTVVGNVRGIKGPGVSLDMADTTAHDSTSAWEESVATILRSGEVTLDIVYDPANAQIKNASGGLLYLLTTRASASFTITFPDANTIVFTGFVVGFDPDAPHDGALTATVKIKPTGVVTLP